MPAPERIGRYRVTGELGRGAMGTVYRAHDDALDREIALKVMLQGLVDADARARFQREARAAARLAHPNIVVVYELGEHEGAPFMALELLEGVDLAHAIEGGIRPDPRATLPLVLQMLAGLGHAHQHGIVHRDVKPSNVFLPYGRPAKIMDFGVARLAGLGTTTSGTLVGTPNYMSPEQVGAGELDGRSDLFSVGLILYELLTGDKAVRADTVVAALYKILHETPDLSVLPGGPGWSEVRAVLERALARRREDRYASAPAMADDLGRALLALGGTLDLSMATDQLLILPRRKASASGAGSANGPAARPRPGVASPSGPTVAAQATILSRTPRRAVAPWLGGGAVLLAAAAIAGVLVLWPRLRPGVPPPTPAPSTAPTASPAVSAPPPQRPAAAPATTEPPGHTPTASAPVITRPAAASAGFATPPDAGPQKPPGSPVELLAQAREQLDRAHWSSALAAARAVLDATPGNREASLIAQEAEAEIVIEDCLGKARAALRSGDREAALDEVRRGFMVRKSDERLLALHREALQQ